MSEHNMHMDSAALNQTTADPTSPEDALEQFAVAILKLKDERDAHQATFIERIHVYGTLDAIFPGGEGAARADYIWRALRHVVDGQPTAFEDMVVLWDTQVAHLRETTLTRSLPPNPNTKDVWRHQARSYMFRYSIPEIQDLLDTVLVPGVVEYYMTTPKG